VIGKFNGPDFLVKSCTVDLLGYNKAKEENEKLRTKEAICVNFCCGSGLLLDNERPGAEIQEVKFYFDFGEKFKDRIERVWRRFRKRREHPHWVDQIKSIEPASAKDVSALQAADVVAWIVNAHYYRERVAKSPPDCFLDSVHPIYYWVKALRLMLGLMGEMHGFYDYEKIKSDYANE